jgi:hypothetical protein
MRVRPNRRAVAVIVPRWEERHFHSCTMLGWAQFLDGLRRRRGLKPEECAELLRLPPR